ncbi:glycosyltransferase [Vibrio sp. 10N.261.55.A10]|uniref:glycosyltransferase n=1 Tax=Vibrio sp. 10N.261.55.A10 TaxID=3229687 RepID=UPI00354DAC31
MHICIIPSWYPLSKNDIGGCFFREQALALKRYGHDVGVIYPHQISLRNIINSKSKAVFSFIDDEIPVFQSVSFGLSPRVPYINVMLYLNQGIKVFDKYKEEYGLPDILHAHCVFNGGLLAKIISDKYGIDYVITEHSSSYARGNIKKWQYLLAEKTVSKSALNIAVSESFCKLLDNKFKRPNTWTYIPNILQKNFECFDSSINPKNKAFTFCNVSILSDNKGIDLLLKSFSKAFSNISNVLLKIGGDGESRKYLQELAIELGISDKVEFLGMLSRKEVKKLMSSSDAYVLSSKIETFGVVLIESLALGKPVVATRCGGPESIVIDGFNGYSSNVDDIDCLSENMLKMYHNYDTFDNQAIINHCLSNFSEEVVVDKLTKEYMRILAEK